MNVILNLSLVCISNTVQFNVLRTFHNILFDGCSLTAFKHKLLLLTKKKRKKGRDEGGRWDLTKRERVTKEKDIQ